MPLEIRFVDPRELRPPPSRPFADPIKLTRQISRYGRSAAEMPSLAVYEGADGVLLIYDGVTRATRIARLSPGKLVPVEVMMRIPKDFGRLPKIGDTVR